MSGGDSPTFFHGQPWSSWIERIGRDKPLSDEESDSQPSSSVTRLSAEDIDLYGFCPERDAFYGVVCEVCNSIIKPQALIQHIESRHTSGSSFPAPTTVTLKQAVKTPFCKVSKLKKTSSLPQIQTNPKNNHSLKRGIDEVNDSVPESLPHSPESIPVQATATVTVVSSPIKSPGTGITNNITNNVANNTPVTITTTTPPITTSNGTQPRRKRLKTDRSLLKDREYDPDRHCGVLNEETGKPCTRSLTCKAHTVSLRRTVIGRSKTFDKLLAEHRAAKELPTNRIPKVTVMGSITVSTAPTSSTANPLPVGAIAIDIEPETPSSPPVLSLPDSYPLPKAVDLLYRCLAPHGSTKPANLGEEFSSDDLQNLKALAVGSSNTTNGGMTPTASLMTPISVVLPPLSPLPANSNNNENSPVATLIPSTVLPTTPPGTLPTGHARHTSLPVLDGETSIEIDPETVTIYSPIYKDPKTSRLVVQMPRSMHSQSSMSRGIYTHASMPNLNTFNSIEDLDRISTNGGRFNHATLPSTHRHRNDYEDFAEIQLPVSRFSDVSWSDLHPEPLAVSRWLRVPPARKQYNFNIH